MATPRRIAILASLLLIVAATYHVLPFAAPQAQAQPATTASAIKLLIITTPTLVDAAKKYAEARKAAYRVVSGRLAITPLQVEVLTVPQCVQEFPEERPENSVRKAVQKRLIAEAATLPKASHKEAARPANATAHSRLLLIGDVPEEGQPADVNRHVPCFYRHSNVIPDGLGGQEETWENVPSDNPYACRDIDDDIPLFPVGRLPFTTPEQIDSYLAAVKQYETAPPPGLWRARCTIFAGDPGFRNLGRQVRQIIEQAYEMGVVANLDEAWDVGLSYANPESPYTWPAPDFSNRIVEEINRGALILNYLGHGWKDSVDTLRFNNQRYTVFTNRDAARVNCEGRRPIAAFFTCYTGCFDMPGPGLAETLIANPNGPIGVIASSRISAECNLLLENCFLKAVTKDREPTLGDVFWTTKRQLLLQSLPIPEPMARQYKLTSHLGYSEGKRIHLWLYNLFGDPTLRLAYASADVSSNLKATATTVGEPVVIKAEGLPKGTAKVELRLETLRLKIQHELADLQTAPNLDKLFELMRENHAKANDKVVAATTAVVRGTTLHTLLAPKPGTKVTAGDHILKVWAFDAKDHLLGTGSTRVKLATSSGSDNRGADF